MNRPRLLDLFCGGGGCSVGYAQAGFEVVGVDLYPQPHYPFQFICADALTFPLDGFDAYHASPPCQEYSSTRHLRNAVAANPHIHLKLVDQVRTRLVGSGLPWVIENVPGSPLPDALELCGSMFDLPIRRHRWFACSHYLYAPGPCTHTNAFYNVIGAKVRGYGGFASATRYSTAKGETRRREGHYRLAIGQTAMDIDWMTMAELSQAIPPPYTHWIGSQLLDIIARNEAIT